MTEYEERHEESRHKIEDALNGLVGYPEGYSLEDRVARLECVVSAILSHKFVQRSELMVPVMDMMGVDHPPIEELRPPVRKPGWAWPWN